MVFKYGLIICACSVISSFDGNLGSNIKLKSQLPSSGLYGMLEADAAYVKAHFSFSALLLKLIFCICCIKMHK